MLCWFVSRTTLFQAQTCSIFQSTHVDTFWSKTINFEVRFEVYKIQTLSATDVLAPTTMKNAAKCDTLCELQNPVSHQNFERILHCLGSMSVGVSAHTTTHTLVWIETTALIKASWEVITNSSHSAARVSVTSNLVFNDSQHFQGIKKECWHLFRPPISQDYPLNLSI